MYFILIFSLNIYPAFGQRNIKLHYIHDFDKTETLTDVISDFDVYSLDVNKINNNNNLADLNNFSFSFSVHNEQFEFFMEEVDFLQNTNFFILNETGKNHYNLNSNLKTYKGHFKDGRPGYIRLTIGDNNFIYGTIKDETGEYFIEPLHYLETNFNHNNKFVLYNSKNISAHHARYHCHRKEETDAGVITKQNGERNAGQCYKISYSILADYSMVSDPAHPGVANVISHIVAVMNNIQGLYEYDGNKNFTSGIKFDINEIVVSTCPGCDPISDSKIASTVLTQFSQWVSAGGFTKHVQAAQFWTDRIFNNSIIGLAVQSKNLFCESKAHSIIRDYTTTAGLLRTLVAHEIAHNFNGVHDNTSGQILSPTVTVTSTWSSTSKETISNEILSQATCFAECQNDLCESVSNVNISDINPTSFKIAWNPLSSAHKYKIILKNLLSGVIILETITSNHINTLSPPGYTICEKYIVSVHSICPDNSAGDLINIIFSSPTSQGCADFMSDCKVNWPGGMVKFSDKSLNAVSWFWDFGNGTTSATQHPQVSYSQSGVYDVRLTINNGTHSCTKNKLIYILPEISKEALISQNNSEYTELFMPDMLEGYTNVWEYGYSDFFLKTRGNAWKTVLQGNIPKGTYKSALYSPKFELSQHSAYHVSFDISMQVAFCNAPVAAQLQYSTDNGVNWQRLGTAPEFYNNAPGQSCFITSKIFTDRTGWAFTENYLQKNHDLSFLAGQTSVIFRFVFAVDDMLVSGYDVDGMLVDNFTIVPVNLSPLAINANSLTVKKQNDNTNLLEWSANQVSSIAKFEILRSTNGEDFKLLHTFLRTDHQKTTYSYPDENVTNLYTPLIYYQVISFDYDGKKSFSNIVKINNSNFDIKIFPNPINAGSMLHIQNYSPYQDINFRIIDVLSRVVIPDQSLNAENKIDIQSLKPGTYTIMFFEESYFVGYKTFFVEN